MPISDLEWLCCGRTVRDAYAVALGEIAAAGTSPAAEEALKALMAKKPGKVTFCVAIPFSDPSDHGIQLHEWNPFLLHSWRRISS